MLLKVGIWNLKDLSQWFGIKPNTFSKQKQERLEELKEYADYEITDGGKVNIIKIKKFFYKKNSVYQYYKEQILNLEDKIVDYMIIAKRFYKVELNVSLDESYLCVKQIYEEILKQPKYQLCMVIGDRLEPIGIWGQKIYKEEYEKYFQISNVEKFIIQSRVMDGEITPKEAYDLLFPKDVYRRFINRLCTIYNCDDVVNGVVVEDINQ